MKLEENIQVTWVLTAVYRNNKWFICSVKGSQINTPYYIIWKTTHSNRYS